jgi:hypothetical protein
VYAPVIESYEFLIGTMIHGGTPAHELRSTVCPQILSIHPCIDTTGVYVTSVRPGLRASTVAPKHGPTKFISVDPARTNTHSLYVSIPAFGLRHVLKSTTLSQIVSSHVAESNDTAISNVISAWLVPPFRVAVRQSPTKLSAVAFARTSAPSSYTSILPVPVHPVHGQS